MAGRGRRRLVLVVFLGALWSQVAATGVTAAPAHGLLPCVAPVAVPDSGTVVHGRLRNVSASAGVLSNDLNVLGGTSTAALVSSVGNGTLTLDPDGAYRYRSDPDYVGTDTFRYRIEGCLPASNTTTVTITVTNQAPTAGGDSYTATAGVQRSVAAPGVMADDSDGDGDAITANLVSGPGNGTLNFSADGSFRYTATAGFSGTDSFRYRVTDGIAWSNTATVQLTVTAPTPAPTAPPTPTPAPTPTDVIPLPSGLPTLPPLPTVGPPSSGAATTPTPSGGTPSPSPRPTPTAAPSGSLGAGGVPPGPSSPSGSGGPGPSGGASSPVPEDRGIVVGGTYSGPPIELDTGSIALSSFEWAVPVLALSGPGILLIVAMLGQGAVGLVWLPVTRRSMRDDRRRQRTYIMAH